MKPGKARRALTGSFRLCTCTACSAREQFRSEACGSCFGARQLVIGAPTRALGLQLQRRLAQETRRRTRVMKRSRWGTGFEGFAG